MITKWMAILVLFLCATFAYNGCGSDTYDPLRGLKDDDPKVRIEAIEDLVCMADLPGYSGGIKKELREVAKNDKNTNVRMVAITGLCSIEEEKDIFPFLMELLGDPDPYIRAEVLDNLPWVMDEITVSGDVTWTRSRYEDYIPILVDALHDEHPRVREKALEVIADHTTEWVESALKDDTQVFISTLKDIYHNDENYYVRVRAAVLLAGLCPTYAEPIPLLTEAMHRGRIRIEAILALGNYGHAMSYITVDLIEIIMVASVGKSVHKTISKAENGGDLIALLKLESSGSYILEVIEEFEPEWAEIERRGHIARQVLVIHRRNSPNEEIFYLHDYSNELLQWSAAWTLQLVASEPEDIQLMINALDDENPDVRGNILWALSEINPGSYDLFSKAAEMLDDEDKFVRGKAITALGYLGPSQADRIVPVLIDYLIKTDDTDLCGAIESSLSRLGVDPIPIFVESMKDISDVEKMKCVLYAVDIYDIYDSATGDYSQSFIDLLHDESAESRFFAVLILSQLYYKPETPIKLLEEVAAEDQDEEVRRAALDAIEYLTADNRYESQDAFIEKFLKYSKDQ